MDSEPTRRFFKVGKADELPEVGVKVFNAGNARILIARWEGRLYAIDDRCTHDNGPLAEGELEDGQLECPRHGARFDLVTGKALCLPAVGGVAVYSVEIRDGDIYVGLPTNGSA
ncbi:MAG: non-heme iron oxygenase ferredoxin subunit [Candidatus Obscuribacterales bacterium]|nr:non-heme iron oxygenase ferredoxin subunit [Candidatus Obscuribacterales bacterium]